MKTLDLIEYLIESDNFYDDLRINGIFIIAKLATTPLTSELLAELIEKGLEFTTNGDTMSFRRNVN